MSSKRPVAVINMDWSRLLGFDRATPIQSMVGNKLPPPPPAQGN